MFELPGYGRKRDVKRGTSNAFTMLELIFVIVVMGIIGVVGANIFRTTYDNYISTSVNNRLHAETELALQQISNRLQYRIKDSVIARVNNLTFDGLSSAVSTTTYNTIEWIGYDIDGWQGEWNATAGFNRPTWSGFIDVDDFIPAANYNGPLSSPGTNTGRVDAIIQELGSSTINNAAIFFIGANSNVQTDYGWEGTAQDEQNNTAAHRITTGANIDDLNASVDNFSNVDVYEQYRLAWTAYALNVEDSDGDGDNDLVLYYDYQPWEGDTFDNQGTGDLLLKNVDTVQVQAIGDVIKVQICAHDENTFGSGRYALCKEKVIF